MRIDFAQLEAAGLRAEVNKEGTALDIWPVKFSERLARQTRDLAQCAGLSDKYTDELITLINELRIIQVIRS